MIIHAIDAAMIIASLIPFPDIDPVLVSFELFGYTLAIRWYALAYVAAFLLGAWWIKWLIHKPALWKNDTLPMTPKELDIFVTWMILGVILGGRLGYVLFYNLGFFIENPSHIIRVWEGGLSFHGGFLGVILAGLLFCKLYKLNAWAVGDALAFCVPIGLFLGRVANFINAELWGRPTDMPWGVVFPGYEAQNCPFWWPGEICARHPSQLYEAVLEGIILFLVIAYLVFRRQGFKIPGQMVGVFFTGYGLARTFVEGFRQGDIQFTELNNPWGHVIRFGQEFDSLGLTMGQVLSIPMIVVGLFILYYVRKRA